ncbi:MAG: hypothetical protein KAU10_07765 [Dehalococcoidia bacterium]|nr:hypothetical protein [Dehalococcoidia bacterium]
MAALEEFVSVIRETETVRSFLQGLEGESVKLLGAICREYEATDKAVPDHHLYLTGYSSEMILRALVSAEVVIKEPGDRLSLHGYRPTEAGLKHYRAILDEKAI